jgi:hypothetical protein
MTPAALQARLKELLHYEPATGRWTRLVTLCGRAVAGSEAGSVSQGYRKIMVDGAIYKSSRLAVFYQTGEWPRGEVDHRDLDTLNDRWSNLRDATHSQNQANGRAYSNNKSGIKGVYWSNHDQCWIAQISINSKNIQRQCKTRDEAAQKYAVLSAQHFGEFARVA